MLFMYKCSECDTNTAFFETGEQYHVEPTLCPKCGHDKVTFTRKETKNRITISYTCASCAHIWIHELDLTTAKPEPDDPKYLEDCKLYCYSDKVRGWAEQALRAPALKGLLGDGSEDKAAIELKATLDNIERLTIAQVQAKLEKSLLKDGYKDLQFGQPDMGKQVVVPINLIDNKDRSAEDSRNGLYKLITKTLENTNWRLIRTSINYRMGYLTGKLKGYETDEDLRILNKKAIKRTPE